MAVGKITSIILAVVVLVAFLAVLPTIISSTTTASTAASTSGFGDVEAIINLIPLVASVGGIAVAGLIAYQAAKGKFGN